MSAAPEWPAIEWTVEDTIKKLLETEQLYQGDFIAVILKDARLCIEKLLAESAK